MNRVLSFDPVVSGKSRVLVLGTMPSVKSLEAQQYYAHPQNAFWPIMGELFGADRSLPYQRRLGLLDNAGVALWDSLEACVRTGSLDASIRDEAPNDMCAFFAKYPKITHVFFNGAKSESAFRRHITPRLGEDSHIFQRLPSTSPARAIGLEAKVRAWRAVKEALS
jgi:double-stranded uracil-DNA glycosylase